MSDLVEKMAAVILDRIYDGASYAAILSATRHRNDCYGVSAGCNMCRANGARGAARAVLRTIEEAGYQVVPEEPTREMLDAGRNELPLRDDEPIFVERIYEAMLAVAPKISAAPSGNPR